MFLNKAYKTYKSLQEKTIREVVEKHIGRSMTEGDKVKVVKTQIMNGLDETIFKVHYDSVYLGMIGFSYVYGIGRDPIGIQVMYSPPISNAMMDINLTFYPERSYKQFSDSL